MSEYIDRDEVLALVDKGYLVSNGNYDKVRGLIEKIPLADVVPVRHGHWIESSMSFNDGLSRLYGFKCSECSGFCIGESRYCPNCGARMDGDT